MSIENPWDEISAALSEARAINRAADNHASAMAELLRGRLRNVHPVKLAALKRELRDFNIHTEKWK